MFGTRKLSFKLRKCAFHFQLFFVLLLKFILIWIFFFFFGFNFFFYIYRLLLRCHVNLSYKKNEFVNLRKCVIVVLQTWIELLFHQNHSEKKIPFSDS